MDSELSLNQGLHPTPDEEISFWTAKAGNLNAVFSQLQGERVRRVLRILDLQKSTYCASFAKICREAFSARMEANDNVKFLRTLEVWIDKVSVYSLYWCLSCRLLWCVTTRDKARLSTHVLCTVLSSVLYTSYSRADEEAFIQMVSPSFH